MIYDTCPVMTLMQRRLLNPPAQLSQAALARYLGLTVGYVSQLERGTKQPTGALLVLLNVIRRNGMETILLYWEPESRLIAMSYLGLCAKGVLESGGPLRRKAAGDFAAPFRPSLPLSERI